MARADMERAAATVLRDAERLGLVRVIDAVGDVSIRCVVHHQLDELRQSGRDGQDEKQSKDAGLHGYRSLASDLRSVNN